MLRLATSFVLGYHGCDRAVADALLSGEPFRPSANDYDWLGPGIYFWEANPKRARSFAEEASKRVGSTVKSPAVVGAAIDLGLCLDLASEHGISELRSAYRSLRLAAKRSARPMPKNSFGPDKLLRRRDCAVVRWLHQTRQREAKEPIDTVRGMFTEGGPAFPGSGFRAKTHVQVCVCNPRQIKGVFRVRDDVMA